MDITTEFILIFLALVGLGVVTVSASIQIRRQEQLMREMIKLTRILVKTRARGEKINYMDEWDIY